MRYGLIKPHKDYQDQFYSMVKDYDDHDELSYPKHFNRDEDSFEDYLQRIDDMSKGIGLQPGYSETHTYWLVNDSDTILGTARFRPELSDLTRIAGGNIGYDISPSHREKGHGTNILSLLLDKLKATHPGERLLITCHVTNIASNKIILSNGGILESTIISPKTGNEINRYHIVVGSS
ncbi:hypothetical protein COW94_04915 [Candidatus Peregrinibacteria bacterium CG22_combo_CG10-13_8_21_14_all_44_10]|nr:MAG: hypothetical protein AUK45_05505 [Candidatus Peregrinibacteria bacterium CG2_30_44_17]PIP65850.1 MAG: hypothetical protein COW94_04915 [Candidatus Peregrinibacteria bacterium CG22_combo_CG10-13_8_21_14_all_44_10]PJB89482.1 MAG: hypothetical protein CO082_00750 [Candidatus Peregrinibacteria bacterium CG_4_9_14_0_8_um_filter_44_15]